MSRIFISYRRSDSISEAGRIYDYLYAHFGKDSIFKDVDDIDAGDDFRHAITKAVGQCQILLAVIGKTWLYTEDSAGNRRLDNPADLVRLEIETALNRNIRVIPVLLTGVEMPAVMSLPVALQPLGYRNAARVRHDPDFRRDMDRVIAVIQRHFNSLEKIGSSTQKTIPSAGTSTGQYSTASSPKKDSLTTRNLPPEVSSPDKMPVESPVGSPGGSPGSSPVKPPVKPINTQTQRALSNTQRFPKKETPTLQPNSSASVKTISPYALESRTSRRRAMQILGFVGGGLGSALLGKALWPVNWQLPELEGETVNGETVEFNVATVNVEEKTIEIVRKQAKAFLEDLGNNTLLELINIPGGNFMMGSPSSEKQRRDYEGPQRNVTLSSFGLGKYPVTQAQWRAVAALPKIKKDLKTSPAYFREYQGYNLPVERVNWYEAVEFCQRLSAKTGREYRLPTEAEWEYACRAGTQTPFHTGETITTDLANYEGVKDEYSRGVYGDGPRGKNRRRTTAVGSFPANAFGLYDMHGNVKEWCQDYWGSYESAPTDGSAITGENQETQRIQRGGAWLFGPESCRSTSRGFSKPDTTSFSTGFRVSCKLV